MGFNAITIIIFGVMLLVFGVFYLVSKSKGNQKTTKTTTKNAPVANTTSQTQSSMKKNETVANVNKEDMFKFMEFDKIQDNMIIQQKGEKYTAVIKCKGINYSLMSEVEQLSVEEGFMNFLNTLKFPIQLYVQAQTVNLKNNVKDYKDNMKTLMEEYDDINNEYNAVLNSLESTDEEIDDLEQKRSSIVNVLEYGQDIVRYVERLALNKSMLQRSFYVLVSYYKSELSNASSFNKEELLDICYSELFTRVQNIMSGLSMCSVSSSILNSNELAELLYSAYNRDDKNFMSVEQALEAGFHRLYSVSEDAIMKKNQKLAESIRKDAEYKAIVALNKAIDNGEITTEEDAEDAFDQESSKQALEIIKREKVDDKTKQDAKKIIIDEYKKAKKERMKKQEEKIEAMREKLYSNGEDTENQEEDITQENNEPVEDTTEETNEDTIV